LLAWRFIITQYLEEAQQENLGRSRPVLKGKMAKELLAAKARKAIHTFL
jgi:hypothetical protein